MGAELAIEAVAPTKRFGRVTALDVLDLARDERARGTTVLLSSHVLSEVAAVADDVAVIHEGRRVLCQRLATLRATAPRTVDLTFAHEAPADLLGRAPGIRSATVRNSSAEVLVTPSPAALVAAAARHGLVDVVTHEADLSDIFPGLCDGEEVERGDLGLREGAVGAA